MLKTLNKLTSRQLPKLLILIGLFTITSLVLGTNKAEAATLNVVAGTDAINNSNNQCQLSEAIQNINDQAVTNDDCIAGDSNNDTINLPSGTITLSANLPDLTKPIVINGSSKLQSIINANGNIGFYGDFGSSNTGFFDFTFQNFTIYGADSYALAIRNGRSIEVSNINEENSASGVWLHAITVNVSDSEFQDNTGGPDIDSFLISRSGLRVTGSGLSPSDIPTVNLQNIKVLNNSGGELSGLEVNMRESTPGGDVALKRLTINDVYVNNNRSFGESGLNVGLGDNGPGSSVPTELRIDSSTFSNNQSIVESSNPNGVSVTSGLAFGGAVTGDLQITNVTADNNSAINNFDNRVTVAGFVAGLHSSSPNMAIVNATITNNSSVFSFPSYLINAITSTPSGAAFTFNKITIDNNFQIIDILNGSDAKNSIIAGNTTNGQVVSCAQVDLSGFGLSGILDLTPQNLGNNITDDPNCTGYTVIPNILSTLGPLQDNGGPVPTIALLPGSPAISAGGAVLGISTDARGIARPSNPDVGAYQTVQGSTTTTPNNGFAGVAVPNTGLGRTSSKSKSPNLLLIVVSSLTMLSTLILKNNKQKENKCLKP